MISELSTSDGTITIDVGAREAHHRRVPDPMPDRTAVVDALRAAGCVYAEDEARLLMAAVHDGPGTGLRSMLERRLRGEPLEVVLGWASFRGLRIGVQAGVFVPRRRTEFLVAVAVPLLAPGDVLVDMCCGSGAVAVALMTEIPGLQVYAADVDPVAVACARRNLDPLGGVAYQGDLFDALPVALAGGISVITVNAPYVPTAHLGLLPPEARDHEPVGALDGGFDGVELHRRIAAGVGGWLAPGGHLLIETGRRQEALTAGAVRAGGLRPTVRRSRDGHTAVIVGTRPP